MFNKFLDTWVSDERTVFETFRADAHRLYDNLGQALAPLTETVENLQRDWDPRPRHLWTRTLTDLKRIRNATVQCLSHYDREQASQTQPFPMAFLASAMIYRASLYRIESQVEEVGVIITSYREVCNSMSESALQQRRRVLQMLKELERTTQETIRTARTNLQQTKNEMEPEYPPFPGNKKKPVPANKALRLITGDGKQQRPTDEAEPEQGGGNDA